jgi:hypothetical protein
MSAARSHSVEVITPRGCRSADRPVPISRIAGAGRILTVARGIQFLPEPFAPRGFHMMSIAEIGDLRRITGSGNYWHVD